LDENNEYETSSKEWFYTGVLYGIRLLVNDYLFNIIYSMKIFKQYPLLLRLLYKILYKGKLLQNRICRVDFIKNKESLKKLTIKAP